MIQLIDDGCQQKPPLKSIMILIDFSRAYDKVWHNGLLLKVKRLGIPACYIYDQMDKKLP